MANCSDTRRTVLGRPRRLPDPIELLHPELLDLAEDAVEKAEWEKEYAHFFSPKTLPHDKKRLIGQKNGKGGDGADDRVDRRAALERAFTLDFKQEVHGMKNPVHSRESRPYMPGYLTSRNWEADLQRFYAQQAADAPKPQPPLRQDPYPTPKEELIKELRSNQSKSEENWDDQDLDEDDARWEGLDEELEQLLNPARQMEGLLVASELDLTELYQDNLSLVHQHLADEAGITASNRFDLYGNRDAKAFWTAFEAA